MARVLVPTGNYGAAFVIPRRPQRHTILRQTPPVRLRRLWRPLDGMATWDPRESWDVMHSFNQVPLTSKPHLITFESALPRTYGRAEGVARGVLRERLVRENCRGVVALSEYAARRARAQNAGWSGWPSLEAKMRVIHPNLPVVRETPKTWTPGPVRLLFVGRQWARKGGVVAVRIARMARERRLPVELVVVSAFQYGAAVYADHPDARRYAADVRLMDAPNVEVHRALPNSEVVRLMAESTFTLLPTVHDTYGFSVLEGLSVGTPALVSGNGALPEVVQDGVNGYVLDLPVDATGDWAHLHERSWEALDALYESLAGQAVARIEAFLDRPDVYPEFSAAALARIREHHDADAVGAQLEALYSHAAAG
jgi:glycosyltransferase involved in cell wall biosynthesis